MKKIIFTSFLLLLLIQPIVAQEIDNFINTAQLEVRVDWQRDQIGSKKRDSECGFKGKFINLILKGDITKNISYAYRQRFSKPFGTGKFFDATDWLYLNWQATDRWSLSGGKQIVALGGFEYDYAPIDIYQYAEFCNMIACYQFGASATYNLTSNDQLTAQVVESPFHNDSTDMYGYNLRWTGTHGAYSAIWAASMLEYKPGFYINYLALGNRFDFKGGHFIFDYMNRYAKGNGAAFFGDFTLSTEFHVQPVKQLNIFAKYAIDKNSLNQGDYCVYAGTKQHHAGIGVEYFPINGRKDLRMHANLFHTWGDNGNADGVLQNKQTTVNIGVTWRANLLNIKNALKK